MSISPDIHLRSRVIGGGGVVEDVSGVCSRGSKEFIRAATDATAMAETAAGHRRLSYTRDLKIPSTGMHVGGAVRTIFFEFEFLQPEFCKSPWRLRDLRPTDPTHYHA